MGQSESMITIGMAGHIDHGKSAVVRALTRMSPDRLPEEQRRGMTIDVGFSWLPLASGELIGIIDVPGHKDFTKNVIAGLWGIDAALLVVAADDGWMPQTEEHLQILRFFGVRHGIMVITKIDVVADRGWLDLVEEDIRGRIAGTPLAGSPVVRVDSVGGTNVDELRQEIERLVPRIERKRDIGKPRLPLDRVFTIRGMGTVVTGTLVDGCLSRDESVFVPAIDGNRRVRGLEVFRRTVEQASAGSRVALNLVGIEKTDLRRGDILFGSEARVSGSHVFDARVEFLPKPEGHLATSGEMMIHSGTGEAIARVRLLGGKVWRPGEAGFARFTFREAVHARIGDRFLMRRLSPPETIGGGAVLDASPGRQRMSEGERISYLEMRVDLGLEALILSELKKSKYGRREELLTDAPYPFSEIGKCVDELVRKGRLQAAGSLILCPDHLRKQEEVALAVLSAEHDTHPLQPGMARAAFRSRLDLPDEAFAWFLSFLRDSGKVTLAGEAVALSAHRPAFSRRQEETVSKITELFKRNPLNPPTKHELATLVPGGESAIEFMCREKKLLGLDEGILLDYGQYVAARTKIVEFLGREGTISIQQVRALTGLSRKYILPLLGRLDKEGLTVKRGDLRALASPTAPSD